MRERIPDSTFDQADQVELVDIEPAELLERLASGNVYREDQAQRATVNFFTLENLTALREIALRRCAGELTDGKRQSTEPRRLPYRRAHSGMSFLVAIQRKNYSDCCKDGKSLSGNIYRSLCGNVKYSGDE